MSVSPDGYVGTLRPQSRTSPYNAQVYVMLELMAGRAHSGLVRVKGITDGLLDVQPMVNMLDADGTGREHGIISGIPYFTLQAGGNAVTMIPEVGDIGMCIFCDRDISSVKENKAVSNPGSFRQSDMADGLYVGGFLNKTPTQYVDFSDAGIHIHSPEQIKLTAPSILIQSEGNTTIKAAKVIVDAPIECSSTIQAGGIISVPDVQGGGKSLKDHTHRAQGSTAITTPPL